MLFSNAGKAVRFDESDVRPTGRSSRGVSVMTLAAEQQVISMLVAENEQLSVLTATENGYGKHTTIAEYTRHVRVTQGVIAIQTFERNGKVIAATLVSEEDEIMLIGTCGLMLCTRVSEIRQVSRATQGVILINLGMDEKLAGLSRVSEVEDQGLSVNNIS